MDIFNQTYFVPILLGVIFIVLGFIMKYFPPKKINSFYGYRLPSSMKNQERWNFAQQYSAKQLIYVGIIMLAVGIAESFFNTNTNSFNIANMILMFVLLGISIYNTEKAIKIKFKHENNAE